MKKLTAILMASIMMAVMMFGTSMAAAEDVVGTWYMQSMEQNGMQIDASVAASMGMSMVITLNEDGTAVMESTDMTTEGFWTEDEISFDSAISYEIVDGELHIDSNGVAMIFSREAPEAVDMTLAPAVESAELSDFNGTWSAVSYATFGIPLPMKLMGTDFTMEIEDGQVSYTEYSYDMNNNFEVTETIEKTFSAKMQEDGTLFVDFNGESILNTVSPGSSGIQLTLHEDGRISGVIPEVLEAMESLMEMLADSESDEAGEAEAAEGDSEGESAGSSGEESLSSYIIFEKTE